MSGQMGECAHTRVSGWWRNSLDNSEKGDLRYRAILVPVNHNRCLASGTPMDEPEVPGAVRI